MGHIPRLNGGQVDSLVEPERLVEDVEKMLVSRDAAAPPRAALTHRGAWFAAMPAGGLGYLAAKLVGVYPGNPSRGLPLVRGILILFDAETGEPLLEADASTATGWRTAAASILALRVLGASPTVVGIIGAGVQAEYHARMLQAFWPGVELLVASRRPGSARRLAQRHGGHVASLQSLLRSSDVVVAATTAISPPVAGDVLPDGAVVVSVGAPKPVRELDTSSLLRGRCVLADTAEGVIREAGDVDPALVEVVGLREVLLGERGCSYGSLRIYKSVGTALLDLAIAVHLYERLP